MSNFECEQAQKRMRDTAFSKKKEKGHSSHSAGKKEVQRGIEGEKRWRNPNLE